MACIQLCPKKCISTHKDIFGHERSYADNDACVDCGVCYKLCPQIANIDLKSPIEVDAAWVNDKIKRSESSSGGLATAISETFIADGGVVYGATFDRPFEFHHVRCSDISALKRLKGSKYVQSKIEDVYSQIDCDLREKRKVLFIGTPCQVAGIKNFFHKRNENLYTIDLICHGVPSVELLKKSFTQLVEELDFDNIIFRDNNKFQVSLRKSDEIIYSRPLCKDLYLKGFFKGLFYRECCYHCKYTTVSRIGDITLGDFWGVNLGSLKANVEEGISLSLVNTDKGRYLMEGSKDKLIIIERPIEEALKGNMQLQRPMKKTWRTHVFSKLYPKLGFSWSVRFAIPDVVLKNLLCK